MKVAVFGGSGFVGEYMINELFNDRGFLIIFWTHFLVINLFCRLVFDIELNILTPCHILP